MARRRSSGIRIQLISRRPRTRSTAPPVEPAWTPADLPGLRLWLDASTLALVDGAAVTVWPDASPVAKSPTAAAGQQPVFVANRLNGRPMVRFAVPQRLQWTANANPMAGAAAGTVFTVHAVAADPPTDSKHAAALVQHWGAAVATDHQPFADGTIYHGWGSSNRKTVGNPPGTMTAARIHAIVSAPADWRYLLDGVTIHSDTANAVAWGDPAVGIPIGLATPDMQFDGWDGDAAEIVAYDRVLSAAELNEVGAYLADKWAVPWTPVEPEPPAFSPADLPGLRLWLDASTLALADGAPIASWPDASGTGNTPTQPNPAKQPTAEANGLNGLPVVRFPATPGSPTVLGVTTNVMAGATAGTVFTLQRAETDPAAGATRALLPGWGTDPSGEHIPFTDGSVYSGWGTTLRKSCGNPPGSLATWRIHSTISAPGSWQLLLDGTVAYSTTTNVVGFRVPDAFAPLAVGSDNYWPGRAAEIVVYDRALSAAELNEVGAYLAVKWAVPWTPVT